MSAGTDKGLWESILRESARRSKLPEGYVFFCGGAASGKTKLLRTFCNTDETTQSNAHANTEILSYDFFDAVQSGEESDGVNSVSVWSVSDEAFFETISVALNPNTIRNAVMMVGVDLSSPTCVVQAKRWLRLLERKVLEVMAVLSPHEKDELVAKQRAYIHSVNGNEDARIPATQPNILGVPIVVVGCKVDLQEVQVFESLKKAQTTLAELRSLCLHYAAALIYTSAELETNCAALRAYLMHRLYPQTFPMDNHTLKSGISDAFVCAGTDSADLIRAAVGGTVDPDAFITAYKSERLPSNPNPNPNPQSPPRPEEVVEDEQTWLASLQTAVDSSVQRDSSGLASDMSAATKAVTEIRASKPAATERKEKEFSQEAVRDFFTNLLQTTPGKDKSKH